VLAAAGNILQDERYGAMAYRLETAHKAEGKTV